MSIIDQKLKVLKNIEEKNNKVVKMNKNEMKEWFKLFKNIYGDQIPVNNSEVTENFKIYWEEFCDRITTSSENWGINDEGN